MVAWQVINILRSPSLYQSRLSLAATTLVTVYSTVASSLRFCSAITTAVADGAGRLHAEAPNSSTIAQTLAPIEMESPQAPGGAGAEDLECKAGRLPNADSGVGLLKKFGICRQYGPKVSK
jgi:hypothetical protein